MSNTGALNIANLQVYAEAAAAADKAAGTFDANHASNRHYYLWQSDFQTIPMGMNGNPERFVEQMLHAVPGINCIRIPFNQHSFNADGSLDPMYERFLVAAASQGLQLIPVLADGDAQQFDGTSAEIIDALETTTFAGLQQGWALMKAWMQNHPLVNDAVYGWELLNEPAAYRQAVNATPDQDHATIEAKMVNLFVEHMIELAEFVSSDSDARVLVNAWGYSSDTETLANTTISGSSAVDLLRATLGDDLVWSLHYYPGWIGTRNITSPAALQAALAELMAPLAGDDILITEINAPGDTTYNPYQPDQVTTATALSLAWLKSSGVGIGWFPALQTGSSGLAMIARDGDIRYLNQASLAAALDAFSSEQGSPADGNSEVVQPDLIAAKLRNQEADLDYTSGRLDDVNFAGLGFGYGGNDTVVGSDSANNFLYGGAGNDRMSGATHDDFLFGQGGDDFLISGTGIDYLFGGLGNDTIVGDYQNDIAYGGAGADFFVLTTGAKFTIVDYSASEGDSWQGSSTGQYVGHRTFDANSQGALDLAIELSDGSEVIFLDQGDTLGLFSVLNGLRTYSGQPMLISSALSEYSFGNQAASTLSIRAALGQNHETKFTATAAGGTTGADSLLGDETNDVISAYGGSDNVYGSFGDDSIDAGSGSDLVLGDVGNDSLDGGTGSDSLLGGSGTDRVAGGAGDDCLSGGFDGDWLDGSLGNDAISGDFGNDGVYGGDGDDLLYGGDGDDQLYGSSGNDLINGGLGRDSAYFEGSGRVQIDLKMAGSQDTGYGQDTFVGIENLVAGSGNDDLAGDNLSNTLFGGAGTDRLTGRMGDDQIFGGAGNDSIKGGIGNDLLDGGSGNDRIRGAGGKDTLDGGVGLDRLNGGSGEDIFVFSTQLDRSNIDRIIGFDTNDDRLFLNSEIFDGLSGGGLDDSAFESNSDGCALDLSDRIIYNYSNGRLYYDADGSGVIPRVLFCIMGAGLEIENTDFWVV